MPRSAAGLGSFWIGGFDMTCRTLAATIALATVGLVTYQPASAETLTVTGWANGYRDVYITSPITAHAGAGTFQVTDGANSFQAWCVDLFHETNFGLAVNDYSTSTSLFDTGPSTSSGSWLPVSCPWRPTPRTPLRSSLPRGRLLASLRGATRSIPAPSRRTAAARQAAAR